MLDRFLWPIAAPFLICAITLPCLALLSSEHQMKRILNAFGSLFNAVLTAYLGLVPLVRERNIPFVVVSILILATSFAAAVSVVVLAFFDGNSLVAASDLIRLLLGPAQNYVFASVLSAWKWDSH